MISSILIKGGPLGKLITNATVQGCQHQQVRFVRKTFRLKVGYGREPLLGETYEKAKENDELASLEYEPVRFALLSECCSPLYDETYEYFLRYVLKKGRKDIAHRLMHETFFYIKATQLKKLRKKLARDEEQKRKEEAGEVSTVSQEILNLNRAEEEVIETDPMVILKTAIKNCEPVVITRKIRRGGATYQVPYPLGAKESKWISIRWLLEAVRERPKPREKHFPSVMAQELIDASLERGKVIKRKDDMHRLADANKAYAHYRWG